VKDIDKFAIEENEQTKPSSVTIYFEGGLAWYEIVSPRPAYSSIFADMQLKAQIWLWIQHKRSSALTMPNRKHWPSLKLLQRNLPIHLKSRIPDPIIAFRSYFIERIWQSHLSGEALAVGPEGVLPQWMETQLVTDLELLYPVFPLFQCS